MLREEQIPPSRFTENVITLITLLYHPRYPGYNTSLKLTTLSISNQALSSSLPSHPIPTPLRSKHILFFCHTLSSQMVGKRRRHMAPGYSLLLKPSCRGFVSEVRKLPYNICANAGPPFITRSSHRHSSLALHLASGTRTVYPGGGESYSE